jgi:hypothetical protein
MTVDDLEPTNQFFFSASLSRLDKREYLACLKVKDKLVQYLGSRGVVAGGSESTFLGCLPEQNQNKT